jgi:nitrogen fixation-related uncharacterized protein
LSGGPSGGEAAEQLLALPTILWTLRSGQYDDLDGAANRILFDDAVPSVPIKPVI